MDASSWHFMANFHAPEFTSVDKRFIGSVIDELNPFYCFLTVVVAHMPENSFDVKKISYRIALCLAVSMSVKTRRENLQTRVAVSFLYFFGSKRLMNETGSK